METSDPPRGTSQATPKAAPPKGPAPVTPKAAPPQGSAPRAGAERRTARRGPGVDAGRLWSGGVMAAGVAGLAAVAALLVVRGVLGVALLVPRGDDVMASASTGRLAAAAAVASLAATGLVHVLALTVPRPGRVLTWLIATGTAAAVLFPFTTAASTGTRLGTAAVNLAIGATIGSLLSAVGRGAVRHGW
ncbi:DUF6069 family protein [Streptomyces sp. NPDC058731]|uniref:DUF6069 family protein n=1 Tax=Streptomyces sp. NPDC058731 TaxID=3346613 RepID=UPI00369095F8